MVTHPEKQPGMQHLDVHSINLADFAVAVDVLGPGRRAIIWVQGCPHRCTGCITPHMQPFAIERERVSPALLAERVLREMPIEGVTLVGGEPFSHAHQLAEMVNILRHTAPLSVVTYTGYTREDITAAHHPAWSELLAITDLLIDGSYIEEQHTDLLWRGSSNQRLHFLSQRYQPLAPYVQNARGHLLELSITAQGRVRVIGIPERGFFVQLTERLGTGGLVLDFDVVQSCEGGDGNKHWHGT
ncbi:MAG: radical SAM protein [Chloroflexaceae bacterium]|nr:radical SAM protein [Chloroflexaceae bacterium]